MQGNWEFSVWIDDLQLHAALEHTFGTMLEAEAGAMRCHEEISHMTFRL